MNFEIRRATHLDAKKLIEAHRRSIREVCSKDYRPEQIAAWSDKNFKEERWCQTMDKDLVWVISDDTQNIFGFGHLKFHEGPLAEIAGLYFTPDVIGAGLGKKLVQQMLAECKKKGVSMVSLSSTKTALGFYKKCGFVQIGEASSLQIGEQAIECFNMELRVAG